MPHKKNKLVTKMSGTKYDFDGSILDDGVSVLINAIA